MANPIVMFRQDKLAEAQAAQTAARDDLTAAQDGLTAKRADLAAGTADLAEAEATVADVRRRLGETPMPADADALSEELEEAIADLRSKQAALIDAEEAAGAAEHELQSAKEALDRSGAAATAAQAAAAEAEARDAEHEAWKDALGEEPLSTLKADATAALASDEYDAAKDRVEADLPAALRNRAIARGNRAAARVAAAQAAATSAEEILGDALADAGTSGTTEQARLRYLRAEAALREYVTRATTRYGRALALLEAVVGAPPPTQPELDRINDPEIVDTDATDAEGARDTALAAVESGQAAVEDARLAALREDVDANPETHADVVAAKAALTQPNQTLQQAQTAYTPALRANIERWAATVPDVTWRELDAFREATTILTALGALDPSDLVDELADAETEYAEALADEDKSSRTRAAIQEHLAERAAKAAGALRTAPIRAFSALRGDS